MSCNSYVEYDLTWKIFDDISDGYITIGFRRNVNSVWQWHFYTLIPNETNSIKVPKNALLTKREMTSNITMEIFPDPDNMPNGGELEIYIFNPKVEKINEREFKMIPQENVEAYFVKFANNGDRYFTMSKNEVLKIEEAISAPNNIFDILEVILYNDIVFYDEHGTNNYHGSTHYWGGYIIKSKNGSYIWLNAFMPWH